MPTWNAHEIIKLLESEASDDWAKYWEAREEIIRKAPTGEILAALQVVKTPDKRPFLCHALGRRCDTDSVPLLISCLYDPDPVCTEAVEALGNIGDARAGPALFERFSEPEGCSTGLLVYALGSVGYRPAIPLLIEALQDPDMRISAALALGALGAIEAENEIRYWLSRETAYSVKMLNRALSAISMVGTALNSEDPRSAWPVLIEALDEYDPLFSQSAAWTLGLIGDQTVLPQLRNALTRQRKSCPRKHRIREAIKAIQARST